MGFLRYFYPFYACPDRILKDGNCISYQHFFQHHDGFADFVPGYFMLGFDQRECSFSLFNLILKQFFSFL